MAIDTRKKNELFLNAPDWSVATKLFSSDEAPKPKRFPVLAHVRIAVLAATADEKNWAEMVSYYNGGAMSGCTVADRYFLASQLLKWETHAGRPALQDAIQDGWIKLSAVADRITPVLRTKLEIKSGVITGMALTVDSPPVG
jgi:hypothetical protein